LALNDIRDVKIDAEKAKPRKILWKKPTFLKNIDPIFA
jgi:hypothetical protein